MFGHAPARQKTVGQARPGNGKRDEVDVFIVLDRFAMPPMLPPKPSILNREEIARSRLFTIEQLDLRFSNGAERRFERLKGGGHGAVMIVAMPDPDHVLLIHEYAAGFDEYALTLPKGLVDPGEDIVTAANRELMEEAGFGAHDVRVLRTLALSPSYMTHHAHIVLARDLYPQRLEGDEPEPLEVIAWPIADLGELVMRDEMSDGRAMAALYIAREWLVRNA